MVNASKQRLTISNVRFRSDLDGAVRRCNYDSNHKLVPFEVLTVRSLPNTLRRVSVSNIRRTATRVVQADGTGGSSARNGPFKCCFN